MNNYILTEIWKAKDSWLALSKAERDAYLAEKINPFLGSLVEQGAEIIGCAVNENDGPERIDYSYMAIWKLPDADFARRLEEGAKVLGFLNYFEQANFSGTIISPPQLNQAMADT